MAGLVGVTPREVVFTSGGTEAVNAAVWGVVGGRDGVGAGGRAAGPILCADVEHSAVRDASARSGPVEVIPVDATARLDLGWLEARLQTSGAARPALVHCQWANHEVGTLQPVHEVVQLCRGAGVPVHVDAVAACGHVPLDLGALGADLVSLSAHKFGGIPGAGALLVRRGYRVLPFVVGGEQERARRGGLEAVPALVAFGAAASVLGADVGTITGSSSLGPKERCYLASAMRSDRASARLSTTRPMSRPRQTVISSSLMATAIRTSTASPVMGGMS